MAKPLVGRRVVAAWRRLLREEEGVALILAIVSMLVLTVTLTTVMFMTAAGARDAHRSNAGQKASALAESGLNNALAVLNSNYPGIVVYPGDPNLLPSRTTTYPNGSATWSGVIEAAPTTASWEDQWRITSVGTVANPTGPASPVTRRTTAIVPIVIPETVSIDPSTSSLNWIYAFNDVRFEQTVTVRSPVYSNRDLVLGNKATIAETIPANASGPERLNKVAVGRDAWINQPNNQIGHVFGSSLADRLEAVYVQGNCSSKNFTAPHHPCLWGADDDIWAATTGISIPPGFITVPKLTCCSPYLGSNGHPELSGDPSVMGFWYRNASIGPNSLCQTSSGTPPRFDRPTGADGPDGSIDQSATAGLPPFDITGATYTCTTGQGELSYDAATEKLTINGSIFIDGSATSTANDATYVGNGALILSGTFSMDNHDNLCVALTGGGDCDTAAPWNPNDSAMFVFASGDFGTQLSTDSGTAGNGIEIKKGQYQGGLFAASTVDASVTGTVVQGPMVSAYGSVATGQGGELSFPSISFPTSGSAGFTGPLPLPRLLAPRHFGGG
jgi:Tfp pilus assembly protein PilX